MKKSSCSVIVCTLLILSFGMSADFVSAAGDTAKYIYTYDSGTSTLYRSADFGNSFHSMSSYFSSVRDVKVSDDGRYVFVLDGTNLEISNDYGISFSSSMTGVNSFWINGNGQYVVASEGASYSSGNAYFSNDYGDTYTQVCSTHCRMPWVSNNGKYMTISDINFNSNPAKFTYSTDFGNTWSTKNIPESRYESDFITASEDGQKWLMTTSRRGIHVSVDGLSTITRKVTGWLARYHPSGMSEDGQVSIASSNGASYVSGDGLNNFDQIATDRVGTSPALFSADGSITAYSYSGEGYLSTNYGASYTSVGSNNYIRSISRDGSSLIAVDVSSGTVSLSSDRGSQFDTIYTLSGLDNAAFNRGDHGTVNPEPEAASEAANYIYAFDAGTSNIQRSDNFGETFSPVSGFSSVKDVKVSDNGEYVFVLDGTDLYISNNFGLSFAAYKSGINSFWVSGSGRYVVASEGKSHNGGMAYVSTDYGRSYSVACFFSYCSVPWVSNNGKYMTVSDYNIHSNPSTFKYSTDYGSTWSTKHIPNSGGETAFITSSEDGQNWLMTTYRRGIHVSTDSLSTITRKKTGSSAHYYSNGMSEDASVSIAASNGVTYGSDDGLSTFDALVSGRASTTPLLFSADGKVSGYNYGGYGYLSTNDGASYSSLGASNYVRAVSRDGSSILKVNTNNGDVSLSVDQGTGFDTILSVSGIDSAAINRGYIPFVPAEYIYLFDYDTSVVRRTADYGESFSSVSGFSSVKNIKVSDEGEYVYVLDGTTLKASDDYGASFSTIKTGINTFWISGSGQFVAASEGKPWGKGDAFFSSDFGDSFTQVCSDNCSVPWISNKGKYATISHYHSYEKGQTSFPARFSYSTDYGATWSVKSINGTMPETSFITASEDGQNWLITTCRRGIYVSTDGLSSFVKKADGSAVRYYPNGMSENGRVSISTTRWRHSYLSKDYLSTFNEIEEDLSVPHVSTGPLLFSADGRVSAYNHAGKGHMSNNYGDSYTSFTSSNNYIRAVSRDSSTILAIDSDNGQATLSVDGGDSFDTIHTLSGLDHGAFNRGQI